MKRRNEVTVGILVTIALIVLVIGSLWLGRGGLSRGYPLYTRFAWGQNLKEGQPVLLAGISIGYVSDVELRRDGYLDVTLNIQKKYKVPRGSTATVQPVGIFGDVAVGLTPLTPAPPTDFAPGDTVPPGTPIPGMGDILLRVDSIGETIIRLEHDFETDFMAAGGMKDVRKATASVLALSNQLQRVVATQSDNLTTTSASFRQSAAQVAQAAQRLSTLVDSAAIDSTFKNLRSTSANLVHISAGLDSGVHQARHVLAQIDSGQGSIGLLLHDPALYNSVTDAVHQMQGLIDDLQKHPRKYINLSIFGGGGR
jgi:phospholipid/cholesterol/gamma-HCH transport system substrate-binding protein